MSKQYPISGTCAPGYERVRDLFIANFAEHGDVGAAVAAWVDGDLVVNLWGGYTNADRNRRWRQDSLASIFSGTKGLTSTCIHLLADRGEIDLDIPVSHYWPEFGRAGKHGITIAQVLGHRSGVIGPQNPLGWNAVSDWNRVCDTIADSEPWWEPGTAQGYHMVTFGFILGEVVRRVTGRSLGHYLRTEISEPMGVDVHIGLPKAHHRRCAEMINKPHIRDVLAHGNAPAEPTSLDEHPMAALSVAMGFLPDDELGSNDLTRWRSSEFPGTNAHVSALGLATVYNGLAQEKILSRDYLERVRVSQGGFDPDVVLGARVADHGWGLGYMLNQRGVAGPNTQSFGHGGSGGSYGFVDLEHRIGYAYVMNYFDATKCNADPRSTSLSNEIYRTLGVL